MFILDHITLNELRVLVLLSSFRPKSLGRVAVPMTDPKITINEDKIIFLGQYLK